MKNKSSIILTILLTLLIGLLGFNYFKVKADSGWDSSYDSSWDSGSDWGSSWDSDWGSSSSWDNDYGSSTHYRRSNSGGGGFILLIIIVVIIIIIASKNKKTVPTTTYNTVDSDTEVDVPIPGFNKEEFLKMTYDNFVRIQNGWMNFDYEELKKLLTNELYNTYRAQLLPLNAKHQKNIMSDFTLVSNKIVGFNESEKEYTVTTKLIVKFYDYVVDENNKVLRGTKGRRLVNTYLLTFIKSKETKDNKCINCGHPLENVNSSVCPYCNSTIIGPTHDFILSKKSCINQRFE